VFSIGDISFGEYPVFLAPMEDVTEPSFRAMCKKYGADMMYTEFASADALVRNVNKTVRKMRVYDYERPVGIQIFGRDIESMVEAAKIAAESKPDLIDINYGCPVKKVAGKGSGAGMLQDVPKMVEMTRQIVDAVDLPVTAKTRLGWDEDSKIIVDVAEKLQDTGIKALTIHGRTRAQMYKGEADWTLIGEVKNNPRMHIPIIGNGDITTAEGAKDAFDRYGVDAIMVGRGSIGNPWIFKEIKHYLLTGEKLPPRSLQETVDMVKEFTLKSVEWKGDVRGVIHMRRQYATAFKGLSDFRDTRIKLLTRTDLNETLELLDEIAERWGE